jgi:hypothetical protein
MSNTRADSSQIVHTSNGSAVTRSLSSKLNDIVSVKDFGAIGDGGGANTDNSPIVQQYLSVGKSLTIPDGVYYFNTPMSVSYSTQGQPSNVSIRYDIKGNSKANTILWYHGSGAFLHSEGALGTDGLVALDSLSNFSLTSVNPFTNNGIYYSQKAYFDLSNIYISGFTSGLTLNACFSGSLTNIQVENNTYGLVTSGAAFPEGMNSVTMRRMSFHLNSYLGWLGSSVGNGNVLDGFNCESNGTMGDANTGGMLVKLANSNNGGVNKICNGYFELNKGGFDLAIENTQSGRAVVTLENLFFNRADSTNYTTYNIKLTNSGSGSLVVVLKGCGFLTSGTYFSAAIRPFFSIGAGCELINAGGNTYSELLSLPNNPSARPGMSGEQYCGDVLVDGTLNVGSNGVTVNHAGTGVYLVTHAIGFGVDVNSYIPNAVSSNNGSGLTVHRITKNNANTFTVVTVNVVGALADCPFYFTVSRLA